MNNQALGQSGEEWACAYLLKKGYVILERNFCNKLGEIDLIAKDGQIICFIEVKTRISNKYGEPFLAVNWFKQRKMIKLALSYLKFRFHTVEIPARFDVISIYLAPSQEASIHHIENAFDLSYISN